MEPEIRIHLNGVMSTVWRTGSIEKAAEVLEEICRGIDEPGISREEKAIRSIIKENRSIVLRTVRRVSLKEEKFNASDGVDYVIRRVFDVHQAQPHSARAA